MQEVRKIVGSCIRSGGRSFEALVVPWWQMESSADLMKRTRQDLFEVPQVAKSRDSLLCYLYRSKVPHGP